MELVEFTLSQQFSLERLHRALDLLVDAGRDCLGVDPKAELQSARDRLLACLIQHPELKHMLCQPPDGEETTPSDVLELCDYLLSQITLGNAPEAFLSGAIQALQFFYLCQNVIKMEAGL